MFLKFAALWHKAKRVSLVSGQTEVKIEFPLPIVACNLMIEYADFYENIQASSETLQCPRCSASVPANPGVCANCGENVFQCHKCRSVKDIIVMVKIKKGLSKKYIFITFINSLYLHFRFLSELSIMMKRIHSSVMPVASANMQSLTIH